MRVCSTSGCATLVPTSGHCPAHQKQKDRARGTTTERGYGAAHVSLRSEWAPIVALGMTPCSRCGHVISAGQPWALDHDDDDRTRYRGPSCVRCNNSAGGKASHR